MLYLYSSPTNQNELYMIIIGLLVLGIFLWAVDQTIGIDKTSPYKGNNYYYPKPHELEADRKKREKEIKQKNAALKIVHAKKIDEQLDLLDKIHNNVNNATTVKQIEVAKQDMNGVHTITYYFSNELREKKKFINSYIETKEKLLKAYENE